MGVAAIGWEAVTWLEGALDPVTDPTAARTFLVAAQEKLRAAGDSELVEAAQELQSVIEAIRLPHPKATATSRLAPTLGWPW